VGIAAALARQLEREVDSLQHLQDILQRENRALVAADVTAIESLAGEKSTQLSHQAELWHARQALLRDAGIAATETALQAFVTATAERDALQHALSHIAELAARCREDNRGNGRLIAQRQRRAQGALDILRGADTPGTDTYSNTGAAAHKGSTSRSLGRA